MRHWIWGLLALWSLPLLAADLKPQRLPQPGDLESILQKRELRALVVYERGFYFLDKGAQYGILVNQLQGFERWLNKTYLAREKVPLKVVYIPVRQDKLLDYLAEGRGDLVAANMTVTPTRREQVTFSRPLISSIEEWVVSQNTLPAFNRITQLSGRRVWVRASSSYCESLRQLNWLFRELGLPPVYIETVPEYLQDGDLLEMVAAGIIPLTVTDSYKGRIWLGGMISGLKAHKLIPLRSKGISAWALRKNSPDLLKAVNRYLAGASRNSLYSDMTLRRLLARSDQMSNILAPDPMGRLATIRQVLEKYAKQYELDWLMLAALAYKESGLNPAIRSEKGAVGIMQLLPSTGREVNITGARLTTLDGNVEAACRYLRLILDTYFNDPNLDLLNRHLFALAAYNAGPNRVQALRDKAGKLGLDPNVWFGNVDQLVANEVGQGPINYVGTIYKYYVGYRFSLPQIEGKAAAIEAAQP
ncbi:lytic transglycosylase F [Aeromonas jandaei]|uniref:transglycosylase SLT domain-containing protein n=1 Tax=Aeromonas jandaei TaxID=650 RepID=UPI00191CA3C1|nr:lytic transglycosylase F [Aeromonas jandaei]